MSPVKANIQIFNLSEGLTLALGDLRDFSSKEGVEGKRALEKRAALELVRGFLGDEGVVIFYEANGKPFLKKDVQISISHAYDKLVVLFSKNNRNVGVDIEKVREKILKIKEKFLSRAELNELQGASLEKYTLYWAVKEAVYKAMNQEGLAFAEQVAVTPFNAKEKEGKIQAQCIQKDRIKEFELGYRLLEDYVLVYTLSE